MGSLVFSNFCTLFLPVKCNRKVCGGRVVVLAMAVCLYTEPIDQLKPATMSMILRGCLIAATVTRLNDLCKQVNERPRADCGGDGEVHGWQDVESYSVAL